MKSAYILLVEDDPFHAEVLERRLREAFELNVLRVATEKDFRKRFDKFVADPPAAVVMDEMLPWTSEEDEDPGLGAPEEGPLRAGNRCYTMLHGNQETNHVPVVFFTNLESQVIPPGVPVVRKRTDPKLTELRSVLGGVMRHGKHETLPL